MTWGAGPWGTGPYGGLATSLSISYAYAISTNEIMVVLNKAPLDRSPFLAGDVRSGGSWSVTIPATNAVIDVAGVIPYNAPLSWIVRTLERLPESTVTVRVSAAGLKDAAGAIIGMPYYADFAGVTEVAVATPTALAATRTGGDRDLLNLPVPQLSDSNISGALSIVGGDYALQEGPDLLRKLIFRRLIATPGDFFHLQTYGVGLKVKQPIPAGDLVKLKTNIERQIKFEPDVSAVVVQLSQSQNIFIIQASATLVRTGRKVSVAINSPIGQG